MALPVPPGGQNACVTLVCPALFCFIFRKGCGNVFQETKLSFSLTREILTGLENLVKALVSCTALSLSVLAGEQPGARTEVFSFALTSRQPLPLRVC